MPSAVEELGTLVSPDTLGLGLHSKPSRVKKRVSNGLRIVSLQYPPLQLFDPVRLRELASFAGRNVGTLRPSGREHLGISISATTDPVDGSIKTITWLSKPPVK